MHPIMDFYRAVSTFPRNLPIITVSSTFKQFSYRWKRAWPAHTESLIHRFIAALLSVSRTRRTVRHTAYSKYCIASHIGDVSACDGASHSSSYVCVIAHRMYTVN